MFRAAGIVSWIVLGASSGLGRALAEELAAGGRSLLLAARDERDLLALAADLRIRYGVEVRVCVVDAASAETATALAHAAGDEVIDGLLLPIGANRDDDRADLLVPAAEDLVAVNFLSIVRTIRVFLPRLLDHGKGSIVGFGSVAAVRGRTHNALYAASKAALQRFFESLRHAVERRGILVQFYVLGYLDTNLAFGRKLLFPKADPRTVASVVVRNLGQRGGTWYLPRFWKVVAMLVRLLPWPLFKRLQF